VLAPTKWPAIAASDREEEVTAQHHSVLARPVVTRGSWASSFWRPTPHAVECTLLPARAMVLGRCLSLEAGCQRARLDPSTRRHRQSRFGSALPRTTTR